MLITNYDMPQFDTWLNAFVYPVTTRIVEQQQSSTGAIKEIDLSRFTEILQNLNAGPRDFLPQTDDILVGMVQVKDSLLQAGITGQAQIGTQMTGTDFLEDLSNNIQV